MCCYRHEAAEMDQRVIEICLVGIAAAVKSHGNLHSARLQYLIGDLEFVSFAHRDRHIRAVVVDQTDLLLEAESLDNFNANFREWKDCQFPKVIHRAEDVLVSQLEWNTITQSPNVFLLCTEA